MPLNDTVVQEILAELKNLNGMVKGLEVTHAVKQGQLHNQILVTNEGLNVISKELYQIRTLLEQTAGYLKEYQAIIDFALSDYTKRNEAVLRELRSSFTKLAALAKPEMIGTCRTSTKVYSDFPIVNKQYPIYMTEMTNLVDGKTNRAFYRTGFLSNLSSSTYQSIDEGFPICPMTATQLTIVSTSASDAVSGTGAQIVQVVGLDGSYNRVLESVNMNGTTPVTTTNSFTHVDGFFVIQVGSANSAVGTITASSGPTTYMAIQPDTNSWKSGKFHTQNNETAYIFAWNFGSYNAAVRAEIRTSQASGFINGSMIAQASGIANNNSFQVVFPVPVKVPQQGFIQIRGIAKGPQNEVTTSFNLYVRQE